MPSKSSRNAVTHGIHTSVLVPPALGRELGGFDEPVRSAVAFTHVAGESFFLDNMHRCETRYPRQIDRAALQEPRLRNAQPLPDQRNKTILQNGNGAAARPETRQ